MGGTAIETHAAALENGVGLGLVHPRCDAGITTAGDERGGVLVEQPVHGRPDVARVHAIGRRERSIERGTALVVPHAFERRVDALARLRSA